MIAFSINTSLPPNRGNIWILTFDGDVVEVSYNDEEKFWTNRDAWGRNDGEPGSWEKEEILGWSLNHEDVAFAASFTNLQIMET